jgi:DnaB helicase-like protein
VTATHVRAEQRFTRDRRCPVCGGAAGDPRGKRRRCIGYMSADGLYIHCSREEHAGVIAISESSQTYAHRAGGECACGLIHRDSPSSWTYRRDDQSFEIECAYDYRDESGALLFQALRLFPKNFAQRRPDGVGGWIQNIQGVRRVLYRLPELHAADKERPVYIVEGEKDVETLRARGLVATCNPMGASKGAGKWQAVNECARRALWGRHIAIIPDNDDEGRAHANHIVQHVVTYAASVRLFEPLPDVGEKGDVTDWFDAGGTVEQLEQLRIATPPNRSPDSDDAFADRDEEKPRLGRTWDECAGEILARKQEPWTFIRIGKTDVAECRNGSFIPLVAPSGAGKSSLAIQMLIDHALHRGVAIYMTYELDGDEAVGRGIGQITQNAWASVLRGEVPTEQFPTTKIYPRLNRIRVLERDEATLGNLALLVAELRALFPGEPILVVNDYMQAQPPPPGKERGYIANVSAELRRAAKRNSVVIIGISQASTDNSKKLRAGDLLGIDGSATGAESAQIERDAYVILTLGDRKEVDPEVVSWKLSVAKNRMGDPDVVYELHYRGRVGLWNVVGDPRKASEIRAEKIAEKLREKKNGGVDPLDVMFKRLMEEQKKGRREMCTKTYLREGNGFGKGKAEIALDALVHDGRARLIVISKMEGPEGKQRSVEREVYEPIWGARA